MSNETIPPYVDAKLEAFEAQVNALDRLLVELRKLDEYREQILRDHIRERDVLLRENNEHRLSVLNEHSAKVQRLEMTFAPREVVESLEKSLRSTMESLEKSRQDTITMQDERIGTLELWRSNIEGRMWAIAAIPILISVVLSSIGIWAALQQG